MKELNEIYEKIDKIQERLTSLEKQGREIAQKLEKRVDVIEEKGMTILREIENKQTSGDKLQRKNVVHINTINPEKMEEGRMAYVGKYQSQDHSFGSTFGDDSVLISDLFSRNSFEIAKVIDAFSSEERIDIVKELMQTRLSARELMEKLKFATTGKLYHHLSFLEKVGVISKQEEKYFINPRYISCIVLIFAGVYKIIKNNN